MQPTVSFFLRKKCSLRSTWRHVAIQSGRAVAQPVADADAAAAAETRRSGDRRRQTTEQTRAGTRERRAHAGRARGERPPHSYATIGRVKATAPRTEAAGAAALAAGAVTGDKHARSADRPGCVAEPGIECTAWIVLSSSPGLKGTHGGDRCSRLISLRFCRSTETDFFLRKRGAWSICLRCSRPGVTCNARRHWYTAHARQLCNREG